MPIFPSFSAELAPRHGRTPGRRRGWATGAKLVVVLALAACGSSSSNNPGGNNVDAGPDWTNSTESGM